MGVHQDFVKRLSTGSLSDQMQRLQTECKWEVYPKWNSKYGRSLILIEAVCLERHRQLRLLLDAGVNVNCQDPDTGHTPLIRAMFVENSKQRRSIIKTLLNYEGQITKADLEGRTAFSWACLLARNDVIRFLFGKPDINLGLNSVDHYGNDNLTLACISGSSATVRLLAYSFEKRRFDLNRRNCENETALMIAHRLGHYDCVRVLVEESYVATSLPRDILYGVRKSPDWQPSQDSRSPYISLPLIFSVYSDHLTKSFPQTRS